MRKKIKHELSQEYEFSLSGSKCSTDGTIASRLLCDISQVYL